MDQIKNLKKLSGDLVQILVKSNIKTTVRNNLVSVQTASSSDLSNFNEEAVKLKLSTLNFTECEKVLKEKYQIPKALDLIFYKIDYSSALNLEKANISEVGSNQTSFGESISYKIFHPVTKVELNQSLCENVTTTLGIPMPKIITQEIQKVQKKIINFKTNAGNTTAFDVSYHKSKFFTDRCTSLVDENGHYVTVNERRALFYPNITVACKAGCDYKGRDIFKYAICECKNTKKKESLGNIFKKAILKALSSINVEIIFCYPKTYVYPDIFVDNEGFMICAAVYLSYILFLIIAACIRKNMFENDFGQLVYSDCLTVTKAFESELDKKKNFGLDDYMTDPRYVLSRFMGIKFTQPKLDENGNKIGEEELRNIDPNVDKNDLDKSPSEDPFDFITEKDMINDIKPSAHLAK